MRSGTFNASGQRSAGPNGVDAQSCPRIARLMTLSPGNISFSASSVSEINAGPMIEKIVLFESYGVLQSNAINVVKSRSIA
jgi:hypothetical protein